MKRPICVVGALGRTLNVRKVRLGVRPSGAASHLDPF